MVEVSHLTKRYGAHTAVEDLSFTVEKGLVYGFLGPNGAGKTTTMNILTGCLAASEGQVTIGGYDIFDQPIQAKRLVGYLPEQPPLYGGMTVEEYLSFVARAKGVTVGRLDGQLAEAEAVTGVTDVAGRLIRNLSKGYRQRVGIAQALLGSPQVIILDEPTVGLDPLQIVEIRKLIRSLGRDRTVILSSHILSEVQAVCDRVIMVHKGRLVAQGTAAELEQRFAGKVTYHLTVKAAPGEVHQALEPAEGVREVATEPGDEGRLNVTVTASDAGPGMDERISFALSDQRIPVLRLEREQASLEDVFLALTQEQPTGPADSRPGRTRRFGRGGRHDRDL